MSFRPYLCAVALVLFLFLRQFPSHKLPTSLQTVRSSYRTLLLCRWGLSRMWARSTEGSALSAMLPATLCLFHAVSCWWSSRDQGSDKQDERDAPHQLARG